MELTYLTANVSGIASLLEKDHGTSDPIVLDAKFEQIRDEKFTRGKINHKVDSNNAYELRDNSDTVLVNNDSINKKLTIIIWQIKLDLKKKNDNFLLGFHDFWIKKFKLFMKRYF